MLKQVANLEEILSERGTCGVGFISNLDNIPSHGVVKEAVDLTMILVMALVLCLPFHGISLTVQYSVK